MAEDPVSRGFFEALAVYVSSVATGARTLVAIDGRGCSGKSTLATQLADALGPQASVLGVDSFFTPFAQQEPRAPGVLRHLRWQAFTEAIAKFKQGCGVTYQPYDWDTDCLLPLETMDTPVLVVEGLYAMHRDVVDRYDTRIWIEADLATRWNRVLARDGPAAIDRWRDEWVPLEQQYVAEQRPWRRADVILAGVGVTVSDLGHARGEH